MAKTRRPAKTKSSRTVISPITISLVVAISLIVVGGLIALGYLQQNRTAGIPLDLSRFPTKGNLNAPVTIVEFSDYG